MLSPGNNINLFSGASDTEFYVLMQWKFWIIKCMTPTTPISVGTFLWSSASVLAFCVGGTETLLVPRIAEVTVMHCCVFCPFISPFYQGSGESPDGGNNVYMEGVHWIKSKIIGSGAFSTVFAARDVAVGTLMCAKQVSYVPEWSIALLMPSV